MSGVALVLVIGLTLWVRFGCFANPPELPGRPPILDAKGMLEADGTQRLGASWFRRQPGRSLLHLEGDPFSMGFANAALTSEVLEIQERSLIDTVREHFPSRFTFAGIAMLVVLNNRSLSDYVANDLQLEILGLSMGSADPFPEYGPRYNRLLNYHAAHDIAHWVADRPVVGCTAFAAAGKQTRDQSLIVGRMFDFEAGRHFDENKIIGRYVPTTGFKFLSVAWPGMAGAVTGMNSERIWCSLNGAHSASRGRIGTPVSLVIRDVLQHAGTLNQAVEIIRNAKVFVADSYLVADGKTGRAVVVEKTPESSAVCSMENDLIVQANHFESTELKDDSGNMEYLSEGTSLARHRRISQLLHDVDGRIDPTTATEILRDRRFVDGSPLSLGNRSAIDALISTHAVVADVSKGVMWVSRGPHGLGVFDAYSLDAFDHPAGAEIAMDPLLVNGEYTKVTRARTLVAAAQREWGSMGRLGAACRAGLQEAIRLIPNDSTSMELEATALEKDGAQHSALEMWRAALAGKPAFRDQRQRIEASIKRLEGNSKK